MKHILSILFLFLLLLLFPKSVFATPLISISSFPSSVIIGEEFDVVFDTSSLDPSAQYYMKALGGISFLEVDTWNSSWFQQNATWTSMPIFSSNSEGSASVTIKIRFNPSTVDGSKELKIRIRKVGDSTNYDSPTVNLSVIAVTSTPTPTESITVTETPTATPTPTSTQTPTPTPAKSVYKINKPKDQDGQIITSVKIYIDNLYTHHEDDEILEFCDGCFCDIDHLISCGFGEHTIKLSKTGYADWSEQRIVLQGSNYETTPILTKLAESTPAPTNATTPTQTSTPTQTTTPTKTPTVTIIPTLSSTISAVLGESTDSASISSEFITDTKPSPSPENKINKPTNYKTPFFIGIFLAISSGALLYFRHRKD